MEADTRGASSEGRREPTFLRRHWLAVLAVVIAIVILGGALYVRSHRAEPHLPFFCVAAGAIYEPIRATPTAAIAAWLANPEGGRGRFSPAESPSAWHPIGGTGGVDYHDGNGNCLEVEKVPGGWQVTGDGRG